MAHWVAPFLVTAQVTELYLRSSTSYCGNHRARMYTGMLTCRKFQEAKDVICKLAKEDLTFYGKDRSTIAVIDWSKMGLKVVLQQYCPWPKTEVPLFAVRVGGALRCVAAVTSAAEVGYAPMESEALAVTWCLLHSCKTKVDAHWGFPVPLRRRVAANPTRAIKVSMGYYGG